MPKKLVIEQDESPSIVFYRLSSRVTLAAAGIYKDAVFYAFCMIVGGHLGPALLATTAD
jgi:hypothetical protein